MEEYKLSEKILFFKEFATPIKANVLYYEDDRGFTTEPDYITHFTLMTGCAYLGLDINLDNMQIMTITGFCPKNSWNRQKLVLPTQIEEGRILVKTKKQWLQGMGDYLAKETEIYFSEESNWLCIGDKNVKNYNCNIKFMNNAIISLKDNEYKALWINPIYK